VGPQSLRLWFSGSGPASESIVKTGREDSQRFAELQSRTSYPPVALMRMPLRSGIIRRYATSFVR
jgi:hypothetical protein